VRILLDENLPRQLRHHLPGHSVRTVQQQGWTGLRNGDLLYRASVAGFDVLLTVDQKLEFQQNLSRLGLAVLVIVAKSNKFEDLLPLLPAILSAIGTVRPGEIRRVGTP
jgi:hypothetical protein